MPASFLFCELLSPERVRWLGEVLGNRDDEAGTVFLTGDALYSLVDARTHDTWKALAGFPHLRIIADGDELQLQGLKDSVASGSPGITIAGNSGQDAFWPMLTRTLQAQWSSPQRAGFLLCHGPYMNRVTVYTIRFLASVQAAGHHPELYTYLDGVHTLHNGQRPSEFENIARAVSAISGSAIQAGREPWFAACSRCATARGYYQMNPGTGFCEPASCIGEIAILPLKEILSRFTANFPIVSHASGGVVPGPGGAGVPRLVVLITNPPYCTEWTFGGLSLALAAAMDGIPTSVIFIEDGLYALFGNHALPRGDKVFNIQEMIAVTTDVRDLHYFVHGPSLDERGIDPSPDFPMIGRLENGDLARILWNTGGERVPSRILFF